MTVAEISEGLFWSGFFVISILFIGGIAWLCYLTTHGRKKYYISLAEERNWDYQDRLPASLAEEIAASYLAAVAGGVADLRHAVTFDQEGLTYALFEATKPTASESLPEVFTVLCVTGITPPLPDFVWRTGGENDHSARAKFLGTAAPEVPLKEIPLKDSPATIRLFGNDLAALRPRLNRGVRELLYEDADLHIESTRGHLLCYRFHEQIWPTGDNVDAWLARLRPLIAELAASGSG